MSDKERLSVNILKKKLFKNCGNRWIPVKQLIMDLQELHKKLVLSGPNLEVVAQNHQSKQGKDLYVRFPRSSGL